MSFFVGCFYAGLAAAHSYSTLPLLVNVNAFTDGTEQENQQALDEFKVRFRANVEDANKILGDAATALGKDPGMRLGTPTFLHNTSGAQMVKQGDAATRELIKEGEKELRDKQKDKGLKIYIVNSVLSADNNEINGLGDQGTAEEPGRVSFFPDGTFGGTYSGSDFNANSGQFLLHEIGHNAGMARVHNAANNGVHFMKDGLDFMADDRMINEAQWNELYKLFKKYSKTESNEKQVGSFIPPVKDSHTAFVADPAALMTRPLAWMNLTMDEDQQLFADLAWQDAWNLDENFGYAIALGIDYDDNPVTDLFPSYGPGLDVLLEIAVEHSPGFGPFVTGTISYYDPGLTVLDLDTISLFDLGLSAADGDFYPDRHAIQIRHDLSTYANPVDNMPVAVSINEDGSPFAFGTAMTRVPEPYFTSLPVTAASTASIAVTGVGFAPNSDVNVFFDFVESASNLPVLTGLTDGSGNLDLMLEYSGAVAGDHVVSAIDATGIIAVGILTVPPPVFQDGFEQSAP